MVIREVVINNQVGLHARPATFFIQKANEFKCSIWVEVGERKVNAKSLLGVLSLGIVNLVPLPPLDGGKIVVEIIQKVVRRDIPVRVINGISVAVIVLLLVLFVVLLQQDIRNFVFGEIWQ